MDFPLQQQQQYKWPKGAAFVSRTAEPFGGGLLEKERGTPLDSGRAIKKLEWKEAADTLPQQPEGKIRGIDVN